MDAQLQTNVLETNAQLFAICEDQRISNFMEAEMSKAGFPEAYTAFFMRTIDATARGRIYRRTNWLLGKKVIWTLPFSRAELAP